MPLESDNLTLGDLGFNVLEKLPCGAISLATDATLVGLPQFAQEGIIDELMLLGIGIFG